MVRTTVAFAVAIAALALRPDPTRAAPAPATTTAGKIAHAARAASGPTIDGVLDDGVWQHASFVSDFNQLEPVENGPPSRRTEVAFAYDDDALYVAARMFTGGPDDVQAVMTRRDETGAAERIIISLDTFNDRRTAYSFAVTAAGVRADWLHPDDSAYSRDHSFDPVWEAAVGRGTDRWTAEMRIPFSQLRFRDAPELRWGLNINRYLPNRNEDIFWIVVPKGETAWSSRFGVLDGIAHLRPARRIELLPYAAGDLTMTSASLIDVNDPFARERALGVRAGLDARIGLGPSLTLALTVNPDFGQVEADPAVVNLTAFESTFDERRPFFVEGAQLSSSRFYYTRRIGAPPRGRVEADYAELPSATRILGAAKLTGRLPSRLSIGMLSALTQRTRADTYDLATSTVGSIPVEPLTTYNVARVEQELGANSSKVGASVTGVYRDLESGGVLADQFTRWATTGGLDWNLRFDRARYELSGTAGYSAIGGDPAALAAIQRNSTHYFQRPDQDHVRVDPSRDTMLGWSAQLGGARRSGPWRWNAIGFAESPGYEINDLGLLLSGDDLGGYLGARYYVTAPTRLFHAWDVGVNAGQEWNFGGARDPSTASVSGGVTLPSFWRINTSGYVGFPGVADGLTRGGPLAGIGWSTGGGMSVSSASTARTRWSGAVDGVASETGVTGMTVSTGITVIPIDRLQLSISAGYLARTDNRQYVTTVEGAGGASTFGARYLFAEVERRELRVQTRLQVAFTPDLSLSGYAEPFTSSGRFSGFGELPAPRSRGLRVYGQDGTSIAETMDGYAISDGADAFAIGNPDFNVLSLRSTVVVRWELLPGSTLFAVWQQDRGDLLVDGSRAGLATLGDGFTRAGRHTLALKLSYWWSP
ncbi:MAG TPA: DUF5916 domain-containing protein [Kofleriaceae bacterium]|nr:DUF5916 domain-containing protein [Kofleriaceae bacterium]